MKVIKIDVEMFKLTMILYNIGNPIFKKYSSFTIFATRRMTVY